MRYIMNIFAAALLVFYFPAVLNADTLSADSVIENLERVSPWQVPEMNAVLNVNRNEIGTDFIISRRIIVDDTIMSVQDSENNITRLRFADNTVNIQLDERRIFTLSESMKFLDFLSSDFTYYDVLSFQSFESEHESIEIVSEIRNGDSVYRISGEMNDSAQHSLFSFHTRVLYIDANTGLLIEDIAYNREGDPIRRLIYSDYRPVSEYTDLELPHRIEAESLHRKHSRSSLTIEYPDDFLSTDMEQQVSSQHP